jgi:ATP synthase protein I
MLAGGWWAGSAGAISALLGVLTNITAGWAYAMMIARGRSRTAADTLRTLLRAEAVKIILIVLQLWLVLAQYRDVVPAAFMASFILGVLMFPLVLMVREEPSLE